MCNSYFSEQCGALHVGTYRIIDWNAICFCEQMMNLNIQNTHIGREFCLDYSGAHRGCIAVCATYSLIPSVCMLIEILDIIQHSMHVVWKYE